MVRDAFVANGIAGAGNRNRLRFLFISGVAISLFAFRCTAMAAVNVFFSGSAAPALQNEVMAGLTTQWQGVMVQSPFQPGTYSFTITAKRAVVPPSTCPPCLVDISSEPYLYGHLFGETDCRTTDIGIVNKYLVGCSTMSSCQVALSSAVIDMYTIMNGTPTIVVPPGQ